MDRLPSNAGSCRYSSSDKLKAKMNHGDNGSMSKPVLVCFLIHSRVGYCLPYRYFLFGTPCAVSKVQTLSIENCISRLSLRQR